MLRFNLQKSTLLTASLLAVFLAMVPSTAKADHFQRTFRGCLQNCDPCGLVRPGCYFDSFPLYMHCGCGYWIDLRSCDFDTFVAVVDCHGNIIATNDDGGNGLNSRMFFQPPQSGRYRIVVTSYQPHATGHYTLTVSN